MIYLYAFNAKLVDEILKNLVIAKKTIPYVLIFPLAFILFDAIAQSTVDTQRTVRIVMDNSYAPYVFQSSEGKLQGILIDQWRAWEKETGVKAEIYAMDWSEALHRMRAGEFDVIDCIVETADRGNYFDFTSAYNTVEASLYFRNDISGISDLASLKGFPVGVKTGDQHIEKLKAGGVTTVILFHSNDAIIEAAKKKTINVFLSDDPSALYLLNKMGIASSFRHSTPIFRDELRRAVRKGDTATLNLVSRGFAAIPPAKLKQIDEKWFGLTIGRSERYRRYLTYTAYAVALAILLIAGLAGWNRMLREKVLDRTAALSIAFQRLSYHVENSPLAVIEWDKDLFIKRWSSHAEEIFERQASEALGRNLYDPAFTFVYEEDIPIVKKVTDQLISGIVNSNVNLNRNYTKDGKVIYCEWYNSVLRDEEGSTITILSLIHNVTERKKTEDNLQQSYEEIKRLTEHLHKIREEERTRIAREIHDELGQQLTVLRMDVSWLTKRLKGTDEATNDKLEDLGELLDSTVQSVRRISYELRPILLDEFGLVAAMEWHLKEFEKRSGIKTYFRLPGENLQLDDPLKTNLFRILQESLTNVARHSNASQVNVHFIQNANQLVLRVQDNGKGFDKEKVAEGQTLGILGMKERAAALGWHYEIRTEPGSGTVVSVIIPLTKNS